MALVWTLSGLSLDLVWPCLGLDPGDAVDVSGGTVCVPGWCTRWVQVYVPGVGMGGGCRVVHVPPTGGRGLGTGLANTGPRLALGVPCLGIPG